MLKQRFGFLPGVVALAVFFCAGASFASNAYSGVVSDGAYITVPDGTVDNWAILVAPAAMGFEEYNSEGDNAVLKFETYLVQINQYTWRVVARFKYRWWGHNPVNAIWYSGSASYMLVRK